MTRKGHGMKECKYFFSKYIKKGDIIMLTQKTTDYNYDLTLLIRSLYNNTCIEFLYCTP